MAYCACCETVTDLYGFIADSDFSPETAICDIIASVSMPNDSVSPFPSP